MASVVFGAAADVFSVGAGVSAVPALAVGSAGLALELFTIAAARSRLLGPAATMSFALALVTPGAEVDDPATAGSGFGCASVLGFAAGCGSPLAASP